MYNFISYMLFYVHEHTILLKTIIDRSFRNCRQGRPFLTSLCDVTTVDLCRHVNADTSIVTLYLSIVLARANWRKGDLH